MEILRCRTRLAVLWIIKAFLSIAFFLLSFFEPGVLEGLVSGKYYGAEITAGMKIQAGIAFWIPWIMAWAALTLNVSINRWANIILGLSGAIILSIGIFQDTDKNSSAILVNSIMGVILHLLIAWYGWRLPKEVKN